MKKQNYTAFKFNKKAGAKLGAIALSITALALPGCQWFQSPDQAGTTETTQNVAADTSDLIGQQVTVRNVVEDTVGNDGFIVESETGEPVLVLNATGQPFQLPDRNIPIQTTGIVEAFSADRIESQYGLTIDRNLYAGYEGQPTIVAQSIALAPNPENFYETSANVYENQQVAVEGIVRLLPETDDAFVLYDEGIANTVGVLVVGIAPELEGVPIDEGENVAVTGVARPASEQLLRDANFDWDQNQMQEFLSRYTNRPVIVADGVYPSAVSPTPAN